MKNIDERLNKIEESVRKVSSVLLKEGSDDITNYFRGKHFAVVIKGKKYTYTITDAFVREIVKADAKIALYGYMNLDDGNRSDTFVIDFDKNSALMYNFNFGRVASFTVTLPNNDPVIESLLNIINKRNITNVDGISRTDANESKQQTVKLTQKQLNEVIANVVKRIVAETKKK
jgi:hypothetical protein